MRTLKNIAALLMGAILGFAFVSAALALTPEAERTPPVHKVFYAGKQIQTAKLQSYEWHYRDEADWQVLAHENEHYTFPKADIIQVTPTRGAKIRVRINTPHKPYSYRVKRIKDPDNRWKTPPVESTLTSIKRDGKVVAWQVAFRLNMEKHLYYMQIGEEYSADHYEQGQSFGNALYTMKFRTV